MTCHGARVVWEPREIKHSDPSYSRAHHWEFDGGVRVQASASPQRVRVPLSMEAAVDPEEAFVAAIASCHMLWFLDFAQRAQLEVARYCDDASGTMARDEGGRWAFREVVLRPMIAWAGRTPSRAELEALHHQSHEACFLANSVRCEVRVVF
ncbi:MAG TPA: OsmC family protein [Polyangiales bacterium]